MLVKFSDFQWKDFCCLLERILVVLISNSPLRIPRYHRFSTVFLLDFYAALLLIKGGDDGSVTDAHTSSLGRIRQ